MTLVVDAAPLVALADRRDRFQSDVERLLRDEPGELVVPAPVTAEVDYLLGRRIGSDARRAFLHDLSTGRFTVACLDQEDHGTVVDLERRYADLDVGLADISVVVVAHRLGTRRIVTFDERHFRALRPLSGGRFTLLPLDG
ncbi:MAG: PIN domain-containing protein [Actinobacteria bacterium]|nr:PIN domain-containing protein [Actinomycetota bacterium]